MSKIDVCTRCVMDTTDTKITFDASGVCDHCNTFDQDILPVWKYGKGREDELINLSNTIKKRSSGSEFDCIIGMSGGIDSSYLVYLAKEKMGLNPLIFHVDAGWNSQIAVNNIEKIVDGLKLDLYTEVIDWEEMVSLQLSFFKSGVSHIDTPQDHAFFATMYKFAVKHNVKSILTGGNYSTECVRNPLDWMYYQSDSRQLKDIHRRYGKYKLNKFPVTNILWHKAYLPYIKKINLYRPLDYVEYNKECATQFLETNFSFQRYPQKHFESRFTKFYESYWLYERFGFDTRKVQLSSLILTKQISREQALEVLQTKPYDEESIHHEFQFIANKLDIPVEELRNYFTMPIMKYTDYKNIEDIYKLGRKALRYLGKELGGKR